MCDLFARDLIAARQLKEQALHSLALLLTQDDASKALLIDMESAAFDAFLVKAVASHGRIGKNGPLVMASELS